MMWMSRTPSRIQELRGAVSLRRAANQSENQAENPAAVAKTSSARLGTRLWAVALVTLSFASPFAMAGKGCAPGEIEPAELMQALELAELTRQTLAKANAQSAIIARVGQDLSSYGLRYSHLGIVYQTHSATPSTADAKDASPASATVPVSDTAAKTANPALNLAQYKVLHELNECGSDRSGLYREGLGNFFLDDVFAFEVLILIPPPPQQALLASALQGPHALAMHHANYNMLAYPFDTTYQNSNQWGLELLSMVMQPSEVTDRKSAQRFLQQRGYKPGEIEVDPLSRLGASMFRANVSFTEHPLKQRLNGRYQVVTVESVDAFLQQQWPQTQRMVLRLPASSAETNPTR